MPGIIDADSLVTISVAAQIHENVGQQTVAPCQQINRKIVIRCRSAILLALVYLVTGVFFEKNLYAMSRASAAIEVARLDPNRFANI